MNQFRLSSLPPVAFSIVVSSLCMHRAAGQEIGLTPMQATGTLELKQVVNEK